MLEDTSTMKKSNNRNKGFTLAETLITLIIIGIVAAITLPLLYANYTENERKSRVKKVYSMLANAMTFVKADGGDFDFSVTGDEDMNTVRNWYDTYLKPRLNTTRICYNTAGCWNTGDTLSLDGSVCRWNVKGVGIGSNIVTAALADGTLINIDGHRGYNIKSYFKVNTDDEYAMAISFDINGSRGPNMIGKDIFITVFTKDGIVPAYKNATQEEIKNDCSKSGTGYSCINKYLTTF